MNKGLHRVGNLLDLETVSNTTIAFCGLGSVGSLTASMLSYPWKKIILIDPEKLEDNNVERHLLGYSSVGEYKVEAMKKWFLDRKLVPSQNIITLHDVTKTFDLLREADIIVVSIDDPAPCYEINQFAVSNNIPAVYGGVYPMGSGGQTAVIPNPASTCYLCAEKKMGALEYKGKPQGSGYGVDPMSLVSSSGKISAVPSLKHSITAIAADMAYATLQILKGSAITEIVIYAQEWEDLIIIPKKLVSTVSSFVSSMTNLGLNQNFSMGQSEGQYTLKMRQGKVSLSLSKWENCPAHSKSNSADDI